MTSIQHLNPEGLPRNPAFSQGVSVGGPHRTIWVGGQNAVSADGEVVGRGDVGAQTRQALRNLETVLAAGGAGLGDVVRWTVFVVEGQPAAPGFRVFQEVWGARANPPAIGVAYVAGLAHPDFLVEIDAVAVVADDPPGGDS